MEEIHPGSISAEAKSDLPDAIARILESTRALEASWTVHAQLDEAPPRALMLNAAVETVEPDLVDILRHERERRSLTCGICGNLVAEDEMDWTNGWCHDCGS